MKHALVFDSGVGGLSIVSELRKAMPGLHLSYVADDAFRPYGDKSTAALNARLPGLIRTLSIMLEPDVVVIACNTASTTTLDSIRAQSLVSIIGVVPAIKPAAALSQAGSIAVLGTPRTVSHSYVDRLVQQFAVDTKVTLHGSTRLVDLAEAKLAGQPVDMTALRQEIAPVFANDKHVDTVVLACTHFPLLRDELSQMAPRGVRFIDSGAAIARRTAFILDAAKVQTHTLDFPQIAFLINDHVDPARARTFADFGFARTIALGAA